jgi:TetR/AcrR family transcriptional regulator
MFVLNEMNKSPDAFFQRYMAGQALPPIKKLVAEIQAAVQKGIIKPVNPAQLLLNILSLCIFPFVARPLFTLAMNITRAQFDQLISERKQAVQQFIRQAIEA